jgi:hypothetical protein
VDDRLTGRRGHGGGELRLRPLGRGLLWREELTVDWGDGRPLRGHREYHLVPVGPGWEVRHADGALFHLWRPGDTVTHPCADDLYTGVVDGSARAWRVVWEVRGPRKDHRIETGFSRAG